MLVVCLTYLVALGGAGYLSRYIGNLSGIIFYFVILFSLIINAALSGERTQRNVWVALGLAPLIRIISISLPIMHEFSQFIWYIVILIPILVGVISTMRTLKYSLDEIGINLNDPITQLLLPAGGFFLGLIGYFFLKPAAWTQDLTLQSTLFQHWFYLSVPGLWKNWFFVE